MPYTPRPSGPWTEYPVYREFREEMWATAMYSNGDGTFTERNRSDLNAYRTSYNRVQDRSRNKVRKLSDDTIWKPCTDYGRSSFTSTYQSGEMIFQNPDGETTFKLVGKPMDPWLWSSLNLAVFGPFVDGNGMPFEHDFNTRNRLATELMLKVKDSRASYGEALAESRKTINHLAKTATSLLQAYRAARRGNWNGVSRALGVTNRKFFSGQSASSRWLEYQYGWLPLMGDIADSMNLIDQGFRKKAQIASSVRVLKDRAGPPNMPAWHSQCTGSSEVSYKAKVFYRVNDSSLARINAVGLLNPLLIPWELMPFSFVIDWFLPVGNVLDALTATVGVDFIDGFYSTRVVSNYDASPVPKVGTSGCTKNSMSVHTSVSGYRRWRMTGFPLPGLYVKSPFSTKHALSALALLRQLQR